MDASISVTDSSDPNPITTLSLPAMRLGSGRSKVVNLKFAYPTNLAANDYNLIASLATPSIAADAPATAYSPATVNIGPPLVKLVPQFGGASVLSIKSTGLTTASLLIKNIGNIAAAGTLSFDLYDSTRHDARRLRPAHYHHAHPQHPHPPRRLGRHRFSFTAPSNLTPGNYFLIASIQSSVGVFSNVAVIATRSK